jgi:hypothetical protein
MEKLIIGSFLLLLCVFSACKKESTSFQGEEYVEGWTTVLGVRGTDTSRTNMMHARTEGEGIVYTENQRLSAALLAYTPLPGGKAKYTIKVTNRQSCRMIMRWSWEDLAPVDSIVAQDESHLTDHDDILLPNQAKIVDFYAQAKVGKIKVWADINNGNCPSTSVLTIPITLSILPIEFTKKSTKREGDKMVVKWSTEAPQDVDKFIIMWTPTGDRKDEIVKKEIPSIATQKDYITDFPAIKKATK